VFATVSLPRCHVSDWLIRKWQVSRRLVETKREALHVVRTDKKNGDRDGWTISVAECPRAGEAVWYSLYRSISLFSVVPGRTTPGIALGAARVVRASGCGGTAT
jgi:hypothetical protein